jgi:sugar phosphate isomerase/epimerase
MKYTRNEFLKLSGAAAMVAGGGLTTRFVPSNDTRLTLSLASYTFRNFSLDDTIKMAKRLDFTGIALKSNHLPLESSPEDIKKAAEKVRSSGLILYGAGVIYMKTAQEVETAFAYAANANLEMIIAAPSHDLLPLVNEKVRSLNIKVAIHNHGPGDDVYHSPNDVYAKIKDLDKRIGLCMDIGHVTRIAEDPSTLIERYKERLYDMHMKDVNKAAAEGSPVEIGRGVIDIPRVIKTLQKIKYKGNISFEYEKDGSDPLPGTAESLGYVRGVIKTT